jgi:magnesium-protoporphyrin O-methyltransferase
MAPLDMAERQKGLQKEKMLPLPLREGAGGRGPSFGGIAVEATPQPPPPPNPLPRGEGESPSRPLSLCSSHPSHASSTYHSRRGELLEYFDRTAVEAWKRLTSDAPVSRIRATVRAGRDEMRATLLSWLPHDLRGTRVLDAGCGTGALAVEAARRGAQVTAIDLSPTLVDLARERLPHDLGDGHIDFRVGDMLDPALGHFDHVVAMDSLIHYRARDTVRVLAGLAQRTERSMVLTFAPRTAALTVMHAVGQVFPRGNRSPAIEPVAPRTIVRHISNDLAGWGTARTHRVARGFYISQALEVVRP